MILIRPLLILIIFLSTSIPAFCWGFFSHQKINYYAVFLLPPQMMAFYKQHIQFISVHSVDPDKRRYISPSEGPHHFIDIDHYGKLPYDSLPHKWEKAVSKYSEDTLKKYGIGPWWIMTMKNRLTNAFTEKNMDRILQLSAEIGHYIADAHVPLHTNSNHNGQLTGQDGIHAFWESRIPELLADKEWSFFLGKCIYLQNPSEFIWKRVLESASEADSVLIFEKQLSEKYQGDQKYAFENRKGKLIKQYSTAYALAFNHSLNGMIERRMRASVFAVACFWYTAWIDAGQPDLTHLKGQLSVGDNDKELQNLNDAWMDNE